MPDQSQLGLTITAPTVEHRGVDNKYAIVRQKQMDKKWKENIKIDTDSKMKEGKPALKLSEF